MPEREIAVSVIVYAHNAQRTLPRCLRALQGQNLRARAGMEAVVVDGGSCDRTHEIALEFQMIDPKFFRVHRRGDADYDSACRAGLALARGKYVAFCDAKDVAPPDRYQALYDACEAGGAAFAGGRIWDPMLRGVLARRDFLLAHGLPLGSDTLQALVRPAELPLFCTDRVKMLRGVCLDAYRRSQNSAAFYEKMISLAGEPQVMEAMALARRDALDRGHRKFYDAFGARDWVRISRLLWRGAWPSPPAGRSGTCPIRFRPARRRAGPRPAPSRGTPRRG